MKIIFNQTVVYGISVLLILAAFILLIVDVDEWGWFLMLGFMMAFFQMFSDMDNE